jgi:hypothetical protein
MPSAARCLQEAEERMKTEIAEIRAGDDPPARKERKIAKREQSIATGRRWIATSWFNTAVGVLQPGATLPTLGSMPSASSTTSSSATARETCCRDCGKTRSRTRTAEAADQTVVGDLCALGSWCGTLVGS